jgi:MFS family permease
MAAGGMFFSLLTLQPILMNQFASDRSGIAMHLLAPITDRAILIGKALGGFVLFAASSGPVIVAAFILDPGSPPARWLAVVLGGIATYLWTAPVGAILSALFPKASNLGSLGTAGKAHGAVQLLGTVATFLAAAPPALAFLLASSLGSAGWRLPSFMLAWLLLGCMAGVPLFGIASRVFAARRENVALVALGK